MKCLLQLFFSPVYLGSLWSQTGELTAAACVVPSASLDNVLAEKNKSSLTKLQRGEKAEKRKKMRRWSSDEWGKHIGREIQKHMWTHQQEEQQLGRAILKQEMKKKTHWPSGAWSQHRGQLLQTNSNKRTLTFYKLHLELSYFKSHDPILLFSRCCKCYMDSKLQSNCCSSGKERLKNETPWC